MAKVLKKTNTSKYFSKNLTICGCLYHHSSNNYGKDKLLAVYKVQKAGLPTIGGSPGFFDLLFLREFAAYCFAAYCRLIYVCAFFQVWEVYIRLASERGDFVAANGVDVDNAVCAVGNGFY